MFKRVRWIGMGAVLGVGGSVWAQVSIRRRARRLRPGQALGRLTTGLGSDLRDALDEGRTAMQEREAELRDRLRPPRG